MYNLPLEKLKTLALTQNNTEAKAILGRCYANGFRVEKDMDRARRLLLPASEDPSAAGIYAKGACYFFGIGCNIDYKKATTCFRRAADQNCAMAMYALACSYDRGEGAEKDKLKAITWYYKAALLGYSPAIYTIGCHYMFGDCFLGKNPRIALEWFRLAAKYNDPVAQNAVGQCYLRGIAVDVDQRKAVEWLSKSAAQGFAVAQYNLAMCKTNGIAVTKNEKEAKILLTRAAFQGYAEAKTSLAILYFNKGKRKKALRLFDQAVLQGSNSAMYQLGLVMVIDTEKNDEQQFVATELLRMSAEIGHGPSSSFLAYVRLSAGLGVEKDEQRARWYLEDAVRRGSFCAAVVLSRKSKFWPQMRSTLFAHRPLPQQAEKPPPSASPPTSALLNKS